MLTRVEFKNLSDNSTFVMDVITPKAATKFLLTEASGLDPVKADVSTSNLSLLDGESIDNVRVGKRNIVINFDYTPNRALGQSAEGLRQEFYKVAGPGRAVEVSLVIDDVYTRKIDGVVESVISPMFSKETKGQISILCPNPYFRGAHGFATFPVGPSWHAVDYQGDVPTGINMAFVPPVATMQLTFGRYSSVSSPEERLRVYSEYSSLMPAHGNLQIRTIDRLKMAKTDAGRNLIPYLNLFDWWKLQPGSNNVRLQAAPYSGAYPASTYDVSWTNLYGGI